MFFQHHARLSSAFGIWVGIATRELLEIEKGRRKMAVLGPRPRKKFLVELIKPSHYDDQGYIIQW